MDIDLKLVNRALLNAGHEPINEADINAGNPNVRLARAYYLETLREAFSELAWTGSKRRAVLAESRSRGNASPYAFIYDLPIDCAKPLELQENAYFEIEGRYLYTDREKAELAYVSDGRGIIQTVKISGGGSRTRYAHPYLHGGSSHTRPQVVIHGGGSDEADYAARAAEIAPRLAEDFPEYRRMQAEPKFWAYVEKMLSAKYAMKLAGRPELHRLLLEEAAVIREEAAAASRSSAAAKKNAAAWWADRLGLRGVR
ncbi:MAG: hypothetical protein LBO80_04920 [Treponema sp.]|jgi:hypothetical protein|nr:hypothetical protein [Treponema sp.]